MKQFKSILIFLRIIYRKIFKTKGTFLDISDNHFDYLNQDASDLIKEKLLGTEPVMICRFGAGELGGLVTYLNMRKGILGYFNYIIGKAGLYWEDDKSFFLNCGLFPINFDIFNRFCSLMLEDVVYVDILGSWLRNELFLHEELKNIKRVSLPDLEPYFHKFPWSEALRGKKILVIHPFVDTIIKQYKKRELLFADNNVLPEFELKTIKAVQSIANNETGFKDWFVALNHMKEQINNMDFDIAIIGCGAYGFPLAAHVKRIGKKSVHLGGATQALFGIIGKRWEENDVSKFINEYWVRPSIAELPKNSTTIEGGCYW